MSFSYRSTSCTRNLQRNATRWRQSWSNWRPVKRPQRCLRKEEAVPCMQVELKFVAHNVAALGRLVDRFEAYLSHLMAMMEDSSIKSVDRKKLNQESAWVCFLQLLKPSAILYKVRLEKELSVVQAIESISKMTKSMHKTKAAEFEEPPVLFSRKVCHVTSSSTENAQSSFGVHKVLLCAMGGNCRGLLLNQLAAI